MWGGQVNRGNFTERSLTKTDGARKKLYSKKYKSKPFSILCVAKISILQREMAGQDSYPHQKFAEATNDFTKTANFWATLHALA